MKTRDLCRTLIILGLTVGLLLTFVIVRIRDAPSPVLSTEAISPFSGRLHIHTDEVKIIKSTPNSDNSFHIESEPSENQIITLFDDLQLRKISQFEFSQQLALFSKQHWGQAIKFLANDKFDYNVDEFMKAVLSSAENVPSSEILQIIREVKDPHKKERMFLAFSRHFGVRRLKDVFELGWEGVIGPSGALAGQAQNLPDKLHEIESLMIANSKTEKQITFNSQLLKSLSFHKTASAIHLMTSALEKQYLPALELEAVVAQWALAKPIDTLNEFKRRNITDGPMAAIAMQQVTVKNPDMASNWLNSNSDGPMKDWFAAGIVSALSQNTKERDPAGAEAWMATIESADAKLWAQQRAGTITADAPLLED